MRLALTLAALILVVAGPAGAQQKGRLKAPPPSQGLRGSVSAAAPAVRPVPSPAPAGLDPIPQSIFQPQPIASAPVGGAPQQCRLACAQAYYFCLAGDFPDQCSGSWGQCRSGCDAPTLPTSY
ncbi:MAG TPA: hypothetical protein VFW47_07955 [Phenylobacterium sp.]|nr:hypothetical protein [Phenylobacterium sp.]